MVERDKRIFKIGDMTVEMKYSEEGPSFQDALDSFLCRKKRGLEIGWSYGEKKPYSDRG